MTPANEPWRTLSGEHGFTLPEMLTVLAILGTVIAALSSMFVAGLHGEADMNQRFQAQQSVRQAMNGLRREAHCASDATTTTASSVTLSLGTYCPTAAGASQVTWCAVSLGTQRYGLFRKPGGACDATGVQQADYLTSDAIFSAPISVQNQRRLHVALSADSNPANADGSYALDDTFTLRNSGRFGPRISIAPANNEVLVNATLTLTVTLETDLGSGYQPAPNEHVDVTLTNAVGAKYSNVAGTCTNAGANTNSVGQCTLSFSSPTPGAVIAHATSTLTISSTSMTVETTGVRPNSGDALVNIVTP
jgi:prepilin-type N-terminal cleavage/methylation domain-containing protein